MDTTNPEQQFKLAVSGACPREIAGVAPLVMLPCEQLECAPLGKSCVFAGQKTYEEAGAAACRLACAGNLIKAQLAEVRRSDIDQNIDPVTGALTAQAFESVIAGIGKSGLLELMAKQKDPRTGEGWTMRIYIVDLVALGQHNDRGAHEGGDRVLSAVVSALSKTFRRRPRKRLERTTTHLNDLPVREEYSDAIRDAYLMGVRKYDLERLQSEGRLSEDGLRELNTITESLGSIDIIARIGGDELAVLVLTPPGQNMRRSSSAQSVEDEEVRLCNALDDLTVTYKPALLTHEEVILKRLILGSGLSLEEVIRKDFAQFDQDIADKEFHTEADKVNALIGIIRRNRGYFFGILGSNGYRNRSDESYNVCAADGAKVVFDEKYCSDLKGAVKQALRPLRFERTEEGLQATWPIDLKIVQAKLSLPSTSEELKRVVDDMKSEIKRVPLRGRGRQIKIAIGRTALKESEQ